MPELGMGAVAQSPIYSKTKNYSIILTLGLESESLKKAAWHAFFFFERRRMLIQKFRLIYETQTLNHLNPGFLKNLWKIESRTTRFYPGHWRFWHHSVFHIT